MNCPICDASVLRRLFPVAQDRHEWRCARCGVFFFSPLPTEEELKAFYDSQWAGGDTEYQQYYVDSELEAFNLYNNFLPQLDLLASYGFSGNLLDVGCSAGTFLKAAKERGWTVEGLDVGEGACARTSQEAGCPVHCGTLDTVALPSESFDVIHAAQVIEHVLDPHAFLDAAHRRLKPGGALLLSTPIIEPRVFHTTYLAQRVLVPLVSRGREVPFPWALHYPFHVFVQSPRSLGLLLGRHQFKIVHSRKVFWRFFKGMSPKWRVFYRAMNAVFHLLNAGMNIDVLAVK